MGQSLLAQREKSRPIPATTAISAGSGERQPVAKIPIGKLSILIAVGGIGKEVKGCLTNQLNQLQVLWTLSRAERNRLFSQLS